MKALGPCDVCVKAKYTKHCHPTSANGPVKALFRIHTDVHFLSNNSATGYIDFVSFLEDHFNFAVTILINRKSDVACAVTDVVEFLRLSMLLRAVGSSAFAAITEASVSRIMCLGTVPVKLQSTSSRVRKHLNKTPIRAFWSGC